MRQFVRRRNMSVPVDTTRAPYRKKCEQLNWNYNLYDCLKRWVFRRCLNSSLLVRSEHCQSGCSKRQGLRRRTRACRVPDWSALTYA